MNPIETTPQELVDQFLDAVKRNKSANYYEAVVSELKNYLKLVTEEELHNTETDLAATVKELDAAEDKLDKIADILES